VSSAPVLALFPLELTAVLPPTPTLNEDDDGGLASGAGW